MLVAVQFLMYIDGWYSQSLSSSYYLEYYKLDYEIKITYKDQLEKLIYYIEVSLCGLQISFLRWSKFMRPPNKM